MIDPTIGGMFKEVAPKERFKIMERHAQAMKGKFWHPIKEPHCICGVLDCPSPIFCTCEGTEHSLVKATDIEYACRCGWSGEAQNDFVEHLKKTREKERKRE